MQSPFEGRFSDKSLSDMSIVWNDGATAFTAIKINVTDTASAAGSLLMDLQTGGGSKFAVTKVGNTIQPNNAQVRFLDSGSTERTALWMDTSDNLNLGTSAGGNLILVNGSSYTERARFSNTGALSVNCTTDISGSSTTEGLHYNASSSYLAVSRDGGAVAYLNRMSSAGSVFEIREDGSTLGSFGTNATTGGAYFAPTSSSDVVWLSGSGTPESSVTAGIGSMYTRTDGGASTTLYIKESGTGNTGWVAK